jgi:hypothetical protein
MTFKIDENLPHDVADLLRAAGHEAHTIDEEGLQGIVEIDRVRIRNGATP